MNALLPHALRHAAAAKGVLSASQSFGVVTLAIVIALLLEREILRLAGADRARLRSLSVVVTPLVVVVALTIVARVVAIIG